MSTMLTENSLGGAAVLDRLAHLMPHLQHRFQTTQPFHDGGFDSLDLVELLCVIESEFALSLDESDLATATVGELATLIAGRKVGRDTMGVAE